MNSLLSIIFFMLIVFSNINTWQIYGGVTGFHVFIVLFILFVATTLLDFKKYYISLKNQYIFKPLIIFFIWWFLRSVLSFNDPLFHYNTELWQWILLFILFTNYISQNTQIGYYALLAHVISAVIILIIYFFGQEIVYVNRRLTVFEGTNANAIGSLSAYAILIIIFLSFEDFLKWGRMRFLLIFFAPGLLIILIETASRGSLIYLFVGLVFYLLISRINFRWKIIGTLVLIMAAVVAFSYVSVSDVLQRRLTEENILELGGRSYLWASSFNLFLEKPLIGYGDGGFLKSFLIHYYEQLDPHNLFLVLLVTSGLIGFILFMVFLFRLLKSTIINILTKKNIICFVLLLISLMSFLKDGGALNSLDTWIKLSIIAGLSTSINDQHNSSDLRNASLG